MSVTHEQYVDALKEAGGNKTKAAKLLGISRSTFRMKLGETTAKKKQKLTIEEEHKLRRENRELKAKLNDILERRETNLALTSLMDKLAYIPAAPPSWVAPKRLKKKKERAIITTTFSDCHYDEVVRPEQINYVNAYNREIATLRTKQFFENVVRLSRDYISGIEIDGLVLALLGDMVSGMIHDELRETNEDTIINTCLYYSDLIIAGIYLLLDHFGKIFVPCVVGNHGRMDKKVRAKHRAEESFDYLMYHLIAREFRGNDQVEFGISKGSDFRYAVYNTRYQLTHGDQFRGGSGISGMLSPLMLGDHRKRKREQAVGTPYDYLVMGHWHQLGHFKGLIVNGSLKGYDEWVASMNFDYEPPQQALWLTDPSWGKTIDAPVHCLSDEEGWSKETEEDELVVNF